MTAKCIHMVNGCVYAHTLWISIVCHTCARMLVVIMIMVIPHCLAHTLCTHLSHVHTHAGKGVLLPGTHSVPMGDNISRVSKTTLS